MSELRNTTDLLTYHLSHNWGSHDRSMSDYFSV